MSYNLWNDCPKVPITELLSFIVDNRGKTVPTAEKGHKLIATNCVTNNTLFPVYEKVRYLSEETYQNWFRAHPLPGDILFVNKGTPGRVCMVPDPVDFCIAQDMIALRADDSKVYNKYLFAVLRSNVIQQQIYNTNVGDVIPHFKKQFMDQLLIPVPDRKIQEVIGDLYYTLSYKVEHNKKINENLYAQMLAIFTNAKNTASWNNRKLDDVLTFFDNLRKPLSSMQREKMAHIYPYYGATSVVDYVEDYLFEGSYILISEDGANVVDASGRPLTQYTYGKFWVNNHAHIVKGTNGYSEALVYTLLGTLNMQSIVTGAAQPKINQANLRKFEAPLPESDEAQVLSDILNPMLQQMILHDQENERLSVLRDVLLTQLMSGEIDISDI